LVAATIWSASCCASVTHQLADLRGREIGVEQLLEKPSGVVGAIEIGQDGGRLGPAEPLLDVGLRGPHLFRSRSPFPVEEHLHDGIVEAVDNRHAAGVDLQTQHFLLARRRGQLVAGGGRRGQVLSGTGRLGQRGPRRQGHQNGRH